ncbi:MAG: CAP domain-containing protein [Methanoregula sp.]
MSDHTPASHHHQKKIHVLGVSRKKKYLKVLIIILFAVFAALAWFTISSGILEDENPEISRHLIAWINTERAASSLPPVTISDTLAHEALLTSQEIRVSRTTYTSWQKTPADQDTDVFIYPKLSWAMSGIRLEPMLFDAWRTNDPGSVSQILNKDTKDVGIGVSSDGYNYYIVTKWQ